MKKITLIWIILILNTHSVFSQKEIEFITAYNKHIDPKNQLDSIRFLFRRIKIRIDYHHESNTKIIEQTQICYYTKDGLEKCIDEQTGKTLNTALISIFENVNEEFIKCHLNFFTDKNELFTFKYIDDSITVLEANATKTNKQIFTFDSKTKNLIQLKVISEVSGQEKVRSTNFLSYSKVNDILVPHAATYTNEFCSAYVEYLDTSFSPFSLSVFNK